jgi:hypothetical protein
LQKKKISDFYTTLTGRKQAGNMQSPVDPPKGDHDAFGKEILAGISFLFFRTDFGDNDQNLQRSVFD